MFCARSDLFNKTIISRISEKEKKYLRKNEKNKDICVASGEQLRAVDAKKRGKQRNDEFLSKIVVSFWGG